MLAGYLHFFLLILRSKSKIDTTAKSRIVVLVYLVYFEHVFAYKILKRYEEDDRVTGTLMQI